MEVCKAFVLESSSKNGRYALVGSYQTREGIFCTLGRKSTAKSLQTLPSPTQTQTRVPRSISNGCRSTARAMAMPARGQRHGDALALRGRVTHRGCDCFDKASSPPLARSDPAIERTPCHGGGREGVMTTSHCPREWDLGPRKGLAFSTSFRSAVTDGFCRDVHHVTWIRCPVPIQPIQSNPISRSLLKA
jgi:hypothetical protein